MSRTVHARYACRADWQAVNQGGNAGEKYSSRPYICGTRFFYVTDLSKFSQVEKLLLII